MKKLSFAFLFFYLSLTSETVFYIDSTYSNPDSDGSYLKPFGSLTQIQFDNFSDLELIIMSDYTFTHPIITINTLKTLKIRFIPLILCVKLLFLAVI